MVPCVRLCYGLTGTKHHRRRRATQPDFHAGRASPQDIRDSVALAVGSRGGDTPAMRTTHRPHRSIPPRSSFAGFRFPPDVIVLAVRWYLRFGLSYRDVEELAERR
jgi:hypothetical protein